MNSLLLAALMMIGYLVAYHTYGKFLAGSARREKVFLTTKISAFKNLRNRAYKELFKTLQPLLGAEPEIGMYVEIAKIKD